jgi:hypothetical protein
VEIQSADDIVQKMDELNTYLREKLRWVQEQQATQANNKRTDPPLYKVGDRVWLDSRNIKTDRSMKKFDDKYFGPYPITRIVRNGFAYELDLPQEMKDRNIFPVFHPSLLRLNPDDPVPGQIPPPPKAVQVKDPETGEDVDEWMVDEIQHCKKLRGKGWRYKVKWVRENSPTWEPCNDYWMNHYDARLYHYNNPRKKKPPNFKFPEGWKPLSEDLDIPGEEDSEVE